MMVTGLILHGLAAMLLLGALAHQAIAAWWPPPPRGTGWWASLRGVHGERYTSAVIVLFCSTVALGSLLYPHYAAHIRPGDLDVRAPWAVLLFEIKEHAAAIGLLTLPAYWASWTLTPGLETRRWFTALLLAIATYNFLTGHVVNNVRGL